MLKVTWILALILAYSTSAFPKESPDSQDLFLKKAASAFLVAPHKPMARKFGNKERLGQALFFDPILSGPKGIACGTCHVRSKGAGDGLPVAIALGGGEGVGEERSSRREAFLIPRNALPFFNRGSDEFRAFFWDGRVQIGPEDNFESPLGDRLPKGFDSLLAVAASLPPAEADEMLGRSTQRGGGRDTYHGDLVANHLDDDYQERTLAVFPKLIGRLIGGDNKNLTPMNLQYRSLFSAAYPGKSFADMGMPEIGNALAAYIGFAFELMPAPWDHYLNGDLSALTKSQKKGALIFFGKGRCAVCHAGTQFSDFGFHGLAIPQYQVGKHGAHTDYGRAAATSRGEDRFKFRTPPLRNVMNTGPWGHNGRFSDLRQAIEHHFNPIPALWEAQRLSPQEGAMSGRLLGARSAILAEIAPLTGPEIDEVLDFLSALTSDTVVSNAEALPKSVPSGLNHFIRE
jgi:cytochrome c peroxidase